MSAVVNQEKCAGCGACIEVCPVEAISFNSQRKAQVDGEKCIECGSCVRQCPNQAIEIVQETTYPSVQRDLPQATRTASVPANRPQTGGTLQSIVQKLPVLWDTARTIVQKISPSEIRYKGVSGQNRSKGKGKRRRHRGGRK
jgi:Fe-S-cluster-containing hydrogenase component 2